MHLIQLFPLSSSFDLQEIKIVVFPMIRKKYKLLKKTVYLVASLDAMIWNLYSVHRKKPLRVYIVLELEGET
jgi:hypothetical protein